MGASVGVRAATLGDSAGIRELAIELGMGATSQRAYNIWCRDFSRWSAVATDHTGQIVGFLIAYPRPARPEHLFIWQLGGSDRHRRRSYRGRISGACVRRRDCKNRVHSRHTPGFCGACHC